MNEWWFKILSVSWCREEWMVEKEREPGVRAVLAVILVWKNEDLDWC